MAQAQLDKTVMKPSGKRTEESSPQSGTNGPQERHPRPGRPEENDVSQGRCRPSSSRWRQERTLAVGGACPRQCHTRKPATSRNTPAPAPAPAAPLSPCPFPCALCLSPFLTFPTTSRARPTMSPKRTNRKTEGPSLQRKKPEDDVFCLMTMTAHRTAVRVASHTTKSWYQGQLMQGTGVYTPHTSVHLPLGRGAAVTWSPSHNTTLG